MTTTDTLMTREEAEAFAPIAAAIMELANTPYEDFYADYDEHEVITFETDFVTGDYELEDGSMEYWVRFVFKRGAWNLPHYYERALAALRSLHGIRVVASTPINDPWGSYKNQDPRILVAKK